MDPLITNGVEPALLRGLEKRDSEREPVPRRKRPPETAKAGDEESDVGLDADAPAHQIDDIA